MHHLTRHRKYQIGISLGVITASISEAVSFPGGVALGLISSLFWIWEQ